MARNRDVRELAGNGQPTHPMMAVAAAWLTATLAVGVGCAERTVGREPVPEQSPPPPGSAFPRQTAADPEWFMVQIELYHQILERFEELEPTLQEFEEKLLARYGPEFDGLSRTDSTRLESLREDLEGAELALEDLLESYSHDARTFGRENLLHFGLPPTLPEDRRWIDLGNIDQSLFDQSQLNAHRVGRIEDRSVDNHVDKNQ